MVLWKTLPSEMDAVVSTQRTATTAVLATLFLLVQLCDANTVYANRGSSPELSCPCPSCSGTQEMSWYYAQNGKTVLLFRKFSNNHIKRFPIAWSWLEMLQNNSLQFHHQRMESYQADSVCYVLSCLFPSKKYYRDVITWWEGRKQILDADQMGRPSIFKGARASQLHICMKKEALEKSRKQEVKCRFTRKTEITFKYSDSEKWFIVSMLKSQTKRSTMDSTGCLHYLAISNHTYSGGIVEEGLQKYADHLKKPLKDVPLSEYTPQIYENI
ncbi:hypothetical protein E2320_014606 [Naja naja]|nr:hypothetical protein E2320_014606 [Naja naja]